MSLSYSCIAKLHRQYGIIRQFESGDEAINDTHRLFIAFFGKKEFYCATFFLNISKITVGILHLHVTYKLVINQISLHYHRIRERSISSQYARQKWSFIGTFFKNRLVNF